MTQQNHGFVRNRLNKSLCESYNIQQNSEITPHIYRTNKENVFAVPISTANSLSGNMYNN